MRVLVESPGGNHYVELKCCICGEQDRHKLQVEGIGLSAGTWGDEYTFCSKCWNSKSLGKNILKILGYPFGMKLIGEAIPDDAKEDSSVR